MYTAVWWGNRKEKDHLEDLPLDERITLKLNRREVGWEVVDWIYLAQDRDSWRTVVNTAMKFRVP
jgi:hypothetical protein